MLAPAAAPAGQLQYASSYLPLLYTLTASAWHGMPVETLLLPEDGGSYSVLRVRGPAAAGLS